MRKSTLLAVAAASLLLSTISANAGNKHPRYEGDFIPDKSTNKFEGDFNPGKPSRNFEGDYRPSRSYGNVSEGDFRQRSRNNYYRLTEGDFYPDPSADASGCLPGDFSIPGCSNGGYGYDEHDDADYYPVIKFGHALKNRSSDPRDRDPNPGDELLGRSPN